MGESAGGNGGLGTPTIATAGKTSSYYKPGNPGGGYGGGAGGGWGNGAGNGAQGIVIIRNTREAA